MKNKAENVLKEILELEPFKEIVSIICQAVDGDVFLVGGFVYRAIIQKIYQKNVMGSDLDFITMGRIKEKELSAFGEHNKHDKYDGFRATHRGVKVDLCEMKNQYHIKKHNLPPTIKSYFDYVPFTIQAIAFDIKKKVILEQKAFDSIKSQEILINNLLIDANWLNEKATKKANEIGFLFKKSL